MEPKDEFVSEADWIPGFWNYLLDLDRDDLIAELVQNDLDQDATRTVITFETDRLVCEGNGTPVTEDGWQRLRKIQGAGDSVPAKRGKIGVKNHGLKTAFTIGDELRLMSAGRSITQTLYAAGRGQPPYPGASARPMPDVHAPAQGCRIIIHYRKEDVEPPHGEANTLAAARTEDLDALFTAACASMPEQFAGIVSPEVVPRYEIVLRHWRLGEAVYSFSCTRPRKIAKRIELFRRRCKVSGSAASLPDALQEQAARRLVPLKGRLRQRVADFYRRGNRFFVEVSWPIDGKGKPRPGTGRFRYPIGYPQDSHEALTGHSTYFNAPIASDNKRHGPARNEATNKELHEACEALLLDVLASYAASRWGPDSLNPLVPNPRADREDAAVRPLLTELLCRKAIPTLRWSAAVELLSKRNRLSIPAAARRATARVASSEPRRYKFVVPVMRGESTVIHPALAVIAPRSELQLDPRIPPDILRLLADGHTDGFSKQFVTFDENDAFDRAREAGNDYFDAPAGREYEFGQVFLARGYLDVINDALREDACDKETEEALLKSLLLPNAHGIPTQFSDLYTSAPLPSDVPGLRLPPILHRDLVSHPLLRRRRKWHRPKYTMERFLESETLEVSDNETRARFWKWLRQNERHITPRVRPKLADMPIWPDEHGNLATLPELCNPRSPRVAEVLSGYIRRPHQHVQRSKLVSTGGKRRTSLRQIPTKHEVSTWLHQRMEPFQEDRPDATTVRALRRFEADLTILLKDKAVAPLLKAAHVTLPAIAQDGSIRPRTQLVTPGPANNRLALHSRFLLNRAEKKSNTLLNNLSSALPATTVEMLRATLAKDPSNFAALHPRLQQFLGLTNPGDEERRQLSQMPLIPLNGEPRPPCQLAFKGAADYWGAWKDRISGKGLSQDDQRRYRAAGVTSSLPNDDTSRAFFQWLSHQDEAVVQRHIPCVLRHILHPAGPTRWSESYPETPFIPARAKCGLRLVPLRTMLRVPLYISDAGEISENIVRSDSAVMLAIDRAKEVVEPISEPLRKLGVRSLREALKEPEYVTGTGEITASDKAALTALEALQSARFRRTCLKRLAELGVDSSLVRNDWYDRLSRIRDIRFADSVSARYRFRGKPYPLNVNAGFDPASNTFWAKRDHREGVSSLYEAIAAQLVFKPASRPIHHLALERALQIEIHDPSFGRPANRRSGAENAPDVDIDAEPNGDKYDGFDDDSELGEAIFGHSPFVPDADRNTPKPTPLASEPSGKAGAPPGGRASASPRKGNEHAEPTPQVEQEHVEALKRDHYASHCQMCLCERPPSELAPAGSYIEWEEVRRRVVEAHHADLKSAGGARHAGNLILLCKLHHDNYGRRLTRAAVTAALQGRTTKVVIPFQITDSVGSQVKGRLVRLTISDTGEIVKIFFTDEHAEYWLSQATPAASARKNGQGRFTSPPADDSGPVP